MDLLPPRADRLILLPDDVLVLILEKLGSARDAVRTCSLVSRRWSRLPWLLPEPKISVGDFLPAETELYQLDDAELARVMGAFRRAVTSFLSNAATDTATTTRCLSLEFCPTNGCLQTVQRLLAGGGAGGTTPTTGKISALQLAIRTAVHEKDCRDAQRRRYARRFKSFMVASPGAFSLLTGLELWNLWLGRSGVAAVLGACPRLERLALHHCHTARSGGGRRRRVEVLVIDAPPPSEFRELVLDMCLYRLVVVRSAPKLARLTCCDMWSAIGAPLSLTGVPCLERLVLAIGASQFSRPFTLSKFLAHATNLRCLSLNFQSEKIWIQPEPPRSLYTAFGKLTALSIGGILAQCDMLWMMNLLEAALFLREFHIAVQKHLCSGQDYEKRREVLWKQSDFKHNHLETLHITGFEAQDRHMVFVRLVMERATKLKIVILADEEPCGCCGFADDPTSPLIESRYPKDEDEKRFTVKQLEAELSSSAQIIMR